MKEKHTYVIVVNGCPYQEMSTEAKSVAQASKWATLNPAAQFSVIRNTVSGTYRSTQQVWPTIGQLYSN